MMVLTISLAQSARQMQVCMCFIKLKTLGSGIWAMVGTLFNRGVLHADLEKTHLSLKRSDVSDYNYFHKAASRRPFLFPIVLRGLATGNH
ncbi:hypothetical protein ABF77_04005 [Enterobacter roggenkampii]|uniref:Uncharacterized protein n=1 Tax=Enterobacter roggenkampii TaxID=1812935 RepID=A0A837LID5_9ENTR|nr:hypothetical protein ABF77_04005 [Enterobacter roggenkampii]